MTDDQRDDKGRFNAQHTNDEYIESVRDQTPAGTREVADDLNVHVETARLRLKQLADDGRLKQKSVGNRLVFTTD